MAQLLAYYVLLTKPVYVKVGYAANFDNSITQNILIIAEYLTLMLGFTLN